MSRDTRSALLEAALAAFDAQGFEATTVASICSAAQASNGSFFHHFGSKEGLAGALYLHAIEAYQGALIAALQRTRGAAQGIEALVLAHIDWVAGQPREARLLFAQSRAEWLGAQRPAMQQANAAFAEAIEAWRAPHLASGALHPMAPLPFYSVVIGPAQLLCRACLSQAGVDVAQPRAHAAALVEAAQRAVLTVPPPTPDLWSAHP